MLLLHISDIHFRHPICQTLMDPDRPFRTELIRDVHSRSMTLGAVDAILVGGDIAFRGAAEEYAAALEWLLTLADACGCPAEKIFVIPGNHDIDRHVIQTSASVRNAQQAIIRADPSQREHEFMTQFQDSDTGRALFAPLSAYNDFAARFNCQVYAPDRLFWQQDLSLGRAVVLRIHGLTSTLLSGAGAPVGKDDNRESLYLSPLQTVLDPVDGVVNLVLCHHPPDWFMDQDDVDDAIQGRAAVQLFGHKHRQRCVRAHDYIRFSAGAVNPSRGELGWQPGYNLIELHVSDDESARYLDIKGHLMVWQTNPDGFHPKMASPNEDVYRHRVSIRGRSYLVPSELSSDGALPIPAGSPSSLATDVNVVLEASMSEERTRNLVFRFWKLASSQRREIALGLGLIQPSEIVLPEPERYGRALARAGERGLLDRLVDEIERRERH